MNVDVQEYNQYLLNVWTHLVSVHIAEASESNGGAEYNAGFIYYVRTKSAHPVSRRTISDPSLINYICFPPSRQHLSAVSWLSRCKAKYKR